MKDWKPICWIIGIPALIVLLMIGIVIYEPVQNGISRGEASRAAVLALVSKEECESFLEDKVSHFQAGETGEWYVKYMDYLYENGYLSEDRTPATAESAEGYITYGEVEALAGQISGSLRNRARATVNNREDAIPKDEWWLFYDSMLNAVDGEDQVKDEKITIYQAGTGDEEGMDWTVYTSAGALDCEGLTLKRYEDRESRALYRGNCLIAFEEPESDEVVYENVWITEGDDGDCLVYVGGITKTMETGFDEEEKQELYNNIVDLYLRDGRVRRAVVKKERLTGRVLAVDGDSIEIEGYGELPLSPTFQVFKTYGTFERKQPKDILVGYDNQEFVVSEGQVCAALIVRTFDADTIRVLLMDTGFRSLFHPSVTLVSRGDMTLTWADGGTETVKAGEEFTISAEESRLNGGRLIVEPADGEEISVETIERSQGTPSYEGRLEISAEQDGLALVNELYLEDYLKRVVPSEMPASYEKEALKAQAVCARTYAYRQIQANGYSQYGAHVDDSTTYQVYNNISTNSRTDAAVDETYGQILTYDGNPIEAFYFSTSCGATADGSIWGGDPDAVPYLKSKMLGSNPNGYDLQNNVDFYNFIRDRSYEAYDSDYAMFRWQTTTTSEILSQKVTGIGTVENITVKSRGAGGVVRELEITGSEGVKTLNSQSQVRSILGSTELTIRRKDGTTMTGQETLPSAFIAIEKDGDSFRIYGGGYGHGAGMSQNGAQGMAKDGETYETILKFFYDGTELTKVERTE
ncbi:MAG TPA: SpoIID/LytB domain-containing protein [Candidatus Lachnoclostridium stercorigallinarum]|uniref:SpoIID/LytB domain-containing protein n=1 Tax=Candidatus Lachnoclostridium stercorigallinarum TaxID=2838634 RepID=A0A9D2GJH2_9FIRM|nr:SpoIID/LytB domain-containing protein [Candidatus Lachnoclostridium stercorigallinarum]